MIKIIDEQGYKDGGAAFNKGKSLRYVIEARFAAMEPNENKDWHKAEEYQESFELGFADAFLTHIRGRR